MTRLSLRLLGAGTALVVAGALAPGTASPAAAEPPVGQPAARAASGITVGDTALSSDSFTTLDAGRSIAAGSPRAQWPIGGGTADLTTHVDTATDVAARKFSRVRMAHYRAYGGVMEAEVRLQAAPTADSRSIVRLAFGRLNSDGTLCNSPTGGNISFSSIDTDNQNNPVYRGAAITVRPFRFPAARRASWNCAFAQTLDPADTTEKYDSVVGRSPLFRQTPVLSIKVKGRKLDRRGYTRVPIIIRNSAGTVATAPNVRLSWRTKGVVVRARKKVGKIRPGTAKKGFFLVKDRARGNGRITFTVRSRNYTRRLTVTVREVRR